MRYKNKTKEIDKLQEEIERFRPIDKALLKQIKEYYRIGLTYSSNRLEGNTLTETETKIVLEDGLTVGGKSLVDHYEAAGHSEAFDLVYDLSKKRTISERDILAIHKLFYYRINHAQAGRYRDASVVITGTDYTPPPPSLVAEHMKKFASEIANLRDLHHPVEAAALLHKGFVDIHPFVDGNGRTARLLMNLFLFQSGYSVTIIPPVRRADYISTIKQSQTGEKDTSGFVNFISAMVYESTKAYLRMLKQLHEK